MTTATASTSATTTASADAAAVASAAATGAAGTGGGTGTSIVADTKVAETASTTTQTTATADVELKVAEGFKVDDGALKSFKATAKELGLDSAKAQKVFDVYVASHQAQVKAAEAARAKSQTEWESSLKSDKDFGGEKFDANLSAAKKAYSHFVERTGEAGKQLSGLLLETGLGSHPAFVKVFHEISKAMADDSIRGTKSGGTKTEPTEDELLRQAFDHPTSQEMFKKE